MKWLTARSSRIETVRKRSLLALLALACLAAGSGCSLLPQAQEAEEIPQVVPPKIAQKPEYPVQTGTIEQKTKGTGKLMSLAEEELYYTESGRRIKEFYVKSGDQVTAGQPIAELDMGDLESQIRQKEIQLLMAQEDVKETLRNKDDKSPTLVEKTKLDYELKQEELNKLKETLANATLRAPFAGTIVSVHAKKGDMVTAYAKVAVVSDYSKLTVAAQFTSDDLKALSVGMKANVDINAVGQFPGTIVQMPTDTGNSDPNIDSIDKYVVVKLDSMPAGLSRGTPLSVAVVTKRKENALIVPSSVLRTHTGQNYVVVSDNGNKREVNVEIGIQTATEVEIVKGLTSGQKVVGK